MACAVATRHVRPCGRMGGCAAAAGVGARSANMAPWHATRRVPLALMQWRERRYIIGSNRPARRRGAKRAMAPFRHPCSVLSYNTCRGLVRSVVQRVGCDRRRSRKSPPMLVPCRRRSATRSRRCRQPARMPPTPTPQRAMRVPVSRGSRTPRRRQRASVLKTGTR